MSPPAKRGGGLPALACLGITRWEAVAPQRQPRGPLALACLRMTSRSAVPNEVKDAVPSEARDA